ncbi:MAG: hypothetical protein RBS39_06360 [Phycisphaerales bacterium]|nr:hypothetical protein [Phycisphaerales bacterium]
MQTSSPSTSPHKTVDPAAIADLIEQVKRLAREYRKRTGRPLGVTGEVAEYEACRLLGLCLAPVRQEGYDAIRQTPDGMRRVQVKGRVLFADAKPGQRLSKISLKHEWDSTIVVVLDEDLEPTIIYEAERAAIAAALAAPGSKSRNERGQLGLSKFKSIARVVWRAGGTIDR